MDKRCLQCGEMFTPKLPTKKFCSGSCRAAWSQGRPTAVDSELAKVADALATLESYLDTPGMWRASSAEGMFNAYSRFKSLAAASRPHLEGDSKS